MSLVTLPRPALNGDTVYVHADMLPRLADAERRLGAPIVVRSAAAGWRAYAAQKHLWDLYRSGRGNLASNPDTGQRGHMRGASVDIYREDSRARAAMRAAGFLPDPAEPWHWNLPNLYSYPIIKTRPAAAPPKDEDMPLNDHDLNRIRNLVREEIGSGDRNYGPLFHRFQQHGDLGPAGWRPATRPDGSPVVADTKAYIKAILWFVGDTHRRLFGDSQKGERIDQGGTGGALDALRPKP